MVPAMSRGARARAAGLSLFLVVAIAGAASAAGNAATKRHFDQGSNAYDVGDYKEAIDHFKAAYKQTPEAIFLFNIGQCYRHLNDPEHAQFFYRSYLRKAPADAPNRADAERWLKELDTSGGAKPPAPAPAPTPASTVQAGAAAGKACAALYGFEGTLQGAELNNDLFTGFKSLAPDRSRPLCGGGALRVDASFDLNGTRNKMGLLPNQAGQVIIKLAKPANLTNKTLTFHVYADAAPNASFGALVFAVNKGKWVGGKFFQSLTAGKWWTITATFQEENHLYEGGSSRVDEVDEIALQVSALGATAQRTWSGRFFVDEVGWN
jgi:tetratricopeptide (TPR) repeat protein